MNVVPAAASILVGQADGGALAGFLPIVLLIVVFYLLLIRPQQKRQRQQRELIASVQSGDRVVTIGGVHGTVRSVDEDSMQLEIAPGTTVTFARQSVARRLVDAESGEA